MPPSPMSRYTTRSLDAENFTDAAAPGQVTTLQTSPHIRSSDLALPIVVPIVVAIVLIVAVLLMPKGFFLNLVSKKKRKDTASTRSWFGSTKSNEKPSQVEPQPAFIESHIGMLRAWQKPTEPQPPLPLYSAKSEYPIRTPRMTFQVWQERQRSAVVRPNPMHDFRPTGTGIRGPEYWKRVTDEMEARKSWWEKAKDKLRI
ncbi:hypothetical protein C7974DRAFT_394271 [Boeremia exigua]|uniref:uncharacterized protein n=1 Tax=Boeremia exigua TaxID=749465 RepID=UPI001E8CA3A6|nr:uncharacterized protein C7974DRAFT_394271 [Boeremia exigua]KAH6629334.1 hypothetical protein C7974DRAFT_394271 [Boeremia exigua]